MNQSRKVSRNKSQKFSVKSTLCSFSSQSMATVMTCVFFIILVSAMFLPEGRQCYEIPEYFYEKCPYADICNKTASRQPPPGQISCCQSCSCDSDCGLHLNCCFDYLDKYQLVEKNMVSCLRPVTGNTKNSFPSPSLYMVTSCSYADLQPSSHDLCVWMNGETSDLLAPVTDLSTYLTYVNEACAKCNNITNFVKWNHYYLNLSIPWTTLDSNSWALDINIERNKGIKYYVPSKEIWKASKQCFTTFTEFPCDKTSSYFTDCEMIRVPVRRVGYALVVYRNIGCMYCGLSPNAILPETCPEYVFERSSGSVVGLSVLLDSDVLSAYKSWGKHQTSTKTHNDNKCDVMSVRSLLKDRCLKIYCPEGMVNTANGCQYAFAYWYRSLLSLKLKLVPLPGTLLPVATIKRLSNEDLLHVFRWIEVPCKGLRPLYYDIYYENSNLTFVKSFDIQLRKQFESNGFTPTLEMHKFERCATQPWILYLENTSYTFLPEFSSFHNYVQDGRDKIWRTDMAIWAEFPRPKIYDLLTKAVVTNVHGRRGYTLILKKTFFCRQVRLPFDEVEINVEEVRILSTNRTLGNNEYHMNNITFIDSNLGLNESSVSVCLYDYIGRNGAMVLKMDMATGFLAAVYIVWLMY